MNATIAPPAPSGSVSSSSPNTNELDSLIQQIDPERMPRHIAVICDGNGRWATKRGLPRPFGHRQGYMATRKIVRAASDLGIEALTLYAFSTENWTRPKTETDAQRVATIPRAASVRVQRVYPSSVRVTVTEREAMVFFDAPDGTHSVDIEGVDFAVEPPPMFTPRLVTPSPGTGDPMTRAAVEVLDMLPPELRVQVETIEAPTASDISLVLTDGRVVVWGGVDRSDRKAAVVGPLLTQPGERFDVASPDLPTVR